MKSFLQHKLPLIICFLIAIAFSLKSVREPDLWWQLKTGDWILEHHEVPKQDVFSYTFEGKPWINIKWGSEVLFASVAKAFGPECIFLIQLLVSCLLVYILLLLCKQIIEQFEIDHPQKNALLIFSILLAIVGIEYRIIGRPEMFSHLFAAIFLLILFRHQKLKNKEIFWLIPLQLLWANMHESFGMGIVLMMIFLASSWFEFFYGKKLKLKAEKPLQLSLATFLSFAIIIINPNGIDLLLMPFNIFGQVFENKFTTELMDFSTYVFWQKEAYIAIIIFIVSVLGLVFLYFSNRKKSESILSFIIQKKLAVIILLLSAFLFLASTAYRNIAFFIIIATPLFYLGLVVIMSKVKSVKFKVFFQYLYIFNIIIGIAIYVSVVSGKYYKWFNRNDRYGLEILSNINPSGAANFIAEKKLNGNAFSDYLTSSYLLWKSFPQFKSFIDLRDLDVFTGEFFETFAQAINDPEVFHKLDSQYHFNYAVVLANPQFSRLHKFLYTDSTYSLAYIDAVTAVYIKQKEKYNTTILNECKPLPQSQFAFTISKIFNPLYQSFNYSKVDNDILAATFFSMLGNNELVKFYALSSLKNASEKYLANNLLGQIYFSKSINDTTPNNAVLMDSAKYFLKESLKENSKYAQVYMDLGAIAFREQRYKEAIKNFDKAISLDKENLNACLYAAEATTSMANQGGSQQNKNIETAINYYKKADRLNPNNPIIMSNLGFLYFRIKDCDKAVFYLDLTKDFDGLSPQEKQQAKECIKSCGH